MDWFFWSIGPKSISWISAFQPGNVFPWNSQLSCTPSREVPTCDTNLPGDRIFSPKPDVNTIQIKAKASREVMKVCWKNLSLSAISGNLTNAFVQVTRLS